MIEPQIIKENGKPKAVIIDYKEYLKLKELQEEKGDYRDGIKSLRTTKKLHKLDDVSRRLGIDKK
ncbi:MAG: type II toxin-antitoxin system Phd/YefM family antitoxin [Spirochaetes bacterium]|nr:MAG: type II toxin-antitoxin system Phd/YefM family antitoxin [Spirochaetota bacterium]